MSYIQRSRVTDLLMRVGYKLDLTPDGSSLPSDTQIKQWLEDACVRMVEILPLGRLTEFFQSASVAIGQGGRGDIASLPLMRLVAVKFAGQACTVMPVEEFSATIRSAPGLYGYLFPSATVIGTDTGAAIEIYPAYSGNATIYYVAEPRPIEDWDNDAIFPWNMLVPPAYWEESMVDYAVAQAKVQDEEIGQAQQLIQLWQEQVAIKMQVN